MRYAGPVGEADAELLERAAAWEGVDTGAQGIDFATAVLYNRVAREPANAAFLQAALARKDGDGGRPTFVGVVPGAFYREHRNTGADGARVLSIARGLGCEAELVPVKSFGMLEENSAAILDWLEAHGGREITLVSLSKGGADIKCALGSPRAAVAFSDVKQWVNFSGLVQGTPLVEWLRERPPRWWGARLILWWQGHGIRALGQLRHGAGSPLEPWPALPAHLRVVHVFGVPLRRHLRHPWAVRGYERLAPLGPNDGGGILLADLASLPGIVCPVWGADHYLDPAWDVLPLLRGIVSAAISIQGT